eukprot:5124915-Pyramimonas_sp.AAC.1
MPAPQTYQRSCQRHLLRACEQVRGARQRVGRQLAHRPGLLHPSLDVPSDGTHYRRIGARHGMGWQKMGRWTGRATPHREGRSAKETAGGTRHETLHGDKDPRVHSTNELVHWLARFDIEDAP